MSATDQTMKCPHCGGALADADAAACAHCGRSLASPAKKAGKRWQLPRSVNLAKNIIAFPVFLFATKYGVDYLSSCCGQAPEGLSNLVVLFMGIFGWLMFVIVT
jgi:phage FluMu protein Com